MVELGRTIAEAERVINTCDGDIVGKEEGCGSRA
jgi:hypothetical protein